MAGGSDGGGATSSAMPSAPAASTQGLGNPSGVGYTAVPTPGHYSAQYAQQSATPFLQSVMAQHSPQMLQNMNLGLPSLQSMFNMPQNPVHQMMPMAPYRGSSYRPDTSGIAAKLNNVAPAVTYEQMHPTPPAKPTFDGDAPYVPPGGGEAG